MRAQASVYQRVCKNLIASETTWVGRSEDQAALAPDAVHRWFNDFLEDTLNKISKKALIVSSDCPFGAGTKLVPSLLRTASWLIHTRVPYIHNASS